MGWRADCGYEEGVKGRVVGDHYRASLEQGQVPRWEFSKYFFPDDDVLIQFSVGKRMPRKDFNNLQICGTGVLW